MADSNIFLHDEAAFNYGNSSDKGSRYFGGTHLSDHPFVKGYFQVFFELPSAIFGDLDNGSYTNILTSTCETFTPHGDRTLNTVDINGQGGVGASYVSGQTITRNFSLMFRETWDAPVYKIFRMWSAAMINPYTGVSDKLQNFVGSEYKGRCMVVETKPVRLSDADTDKIKSSIIQLYYYDGVFPTTDISSVFDSSIQDNTNVQINMNFSFDGFPLDINNKGAFDHAVNCIKNADLYKNVIAYYEKLYTAGENCSPVAKSKSSDAGFGSSFFTKK